MRIWNVIRGGKACLEIIKEKTRVGNRRLGAEQDIDASVVKHPCSLAKNRFRTSHRSQLRHLRPERRAERIHQKVGRCAYTV